MMKRNLWLLLGVIVLAVGPLMFHSETAKFGGSDDQASALISNIQPGYHRWAEPLWAPPSSEIESLIFALQAALGAGWLGYYFGRKRGLAEAKDAAEIRASH
ncbi:MAG: cobalt/nickel transport protein [Gammaproteobacteria bacterium]|jgi:cobalt/nickel transport protein|nr:cobalt/nickel transport protein [Gammaproteobacteria bacterium]